MTHSLHTIFQTLLHEERSSQPYITCQSPFQLTVLMKYQSEGSSVMMRDDPLIEGLKKHFKSGRGNSSVLETRDDDHPSYDGGAPACLIRCGNG